MTRSELYWLVGAVVFGAIVRLSFPGRMAVEHFDEGVYASNLWFPDQRYSYPARYLYAPPLLPAAIEWTIIIASIFGIRPDGFIPMIPSLLAGIAMIPSIWWVARQWFGASAGLITAWLVATSDFHACYSRAALTDVPVCLFILLAVYYIEKAFARCIVLEAATQPIRNKSKSRSASIGYPWREILLAGGFTGLAWWTKYNGWLPLAIGAAGGALWQILTPRPERRIRRTLVCWVFVAVVAAVVWSPVLWSLQEHGGYTSVAANHRQYVVGIRGWRSSAVKQVQNIGLYENPLDVLYSPFAGRSRAFSAEDMIRLRNWRIRRPPNDPQLLMSQFHRTIFEEWTPYLVPICCLTISAATCVWNLLRNRRSGQLRSVCLVAAWFAGLTVATPFYYPYPRLVLPWLCSSWICIGLAFQSWPIERVVNSSRLARFKSLQLVFVVMVSMSFVRLITGSAFAWADRTGLQTVAKQVDETVKQAAKAAGFPENEAFVYVFGEPALVYGLHAEGLPYVGPIRDVSFMEKPPQRPTFILFYLPSIESDYEREQLLVWRFEDIARPKFVRSHLVLNDSSTDSTYFDHEIRLYRQIK